jgi:hypothetical protein
VILANILTEFTFLLFKIIKSNEFFKTNNFDFGSCGITLRHNWADDLNFIFNKFVIRLRNFSRTIDFGGF